MCFGMRGFLDPRRGGANACTSVNICRKCRPDGFHWTDTAEILMGNMFLAIFVPKAEAEKKSSSFKTEYLLVFYFY